MWSGDRFITLHWGASEPGLLIILNDPTAGHLILQDKIPTQLQLQEVCTDQL